MTDSWVSYQTDLGSCRISETEQPDKYFVFLFFQFL